jgi:hypothetical protein
MLVLMLGGLASAAQIYQCEENGRKVFSQEPCGSDAKVVQTSGDRSVIMSVKMPPADINYLCSLSMRSWDRMADEQRNRRAANSYRYYGSSSGSSDERRRAFVLSHISNLEKLAVDDPELYDVAKSLSNRYFSGDPSSYTYDAERARAQNNCVAEVQGAISRLRDRHEREDKARFGKR